MSSKILRRISAFAFILFISLMGLLPGAMAHCPLCTGAVGAAAVSAKYLGMDSSIIGLFIGAFGASTGLWFARKIKRQFVPLQTQLIAVGSLLLTLVPMLGIIEDSVYMPILAAGPPGSFLNKVYWANKLLLGGLLGGVLSIAAFHSHELVKKYKGNVMFPYQGIAFTLAALGVGAAALYFIFG